MMTVSRPASLTAFGGEWVQLFPKDSWENVTNEYEPFTFNDYGAKVPVFRSTSTPLADDAPTEDVLHVYMEVSGEGDYEVKYGNPGLVSGGYWVAVEFKETLLRVGTPWADCTGSTLDTASYDVGTIAPILFGGPNLNSIALKAGFPSYDDVIAELSGVTVPTKIVLEIFNAGTTTYTDSTVDGQCYKAGNTCPEAHLVCDPSYCEMDVWKSLIASFKAAGSVTVLGSVDSSTTVAQYADLDMDGFYFTDAVEGGYTGTSVLALGSPLFDATLVDAATVYVTLASSDLGIWNPFSWYPYVSPLKWAAIVTDAADVSAAATLFERKPICMKTTGVVTTKVADKLCSDAPMDQCACKCFHEAQWTCEGESVVCKAKYGAGELQTVGDKVCEVRGAPKPENVAELRVASTCEPVAAEEEPATEAPVATTEDVAVPKVEAPVVQASAFGAFAFAALALYA